MAPNSPWSAVTVAVLYVWAVVLFAWLLWDVIHSDGDTDGR